MPVRADPQTVRELVLWGERRLRAAHLSFGHGTENALDEAAWLVGSTLGHAPQELDGRLDDRLDARQRAAVHAVIAARISTRKPAAYLLHEAWFAGLRFYVDERVIVPRSLLAEFIEERFRPWVDEARVCRVLDLCTGSGCIAIALAHAFGQARVDASDISTDALAVARINVVNYGLEDRVRLVRSDLFAALDGERYDLIVTNPPYVDAADMTALPPEYRHEPVIALASGQHGLDAIARILARAAAHLNAEGVLVAEVGNSCTALQEFFEDVPFTWLSTARGDESVFLLTAGQLAHWQPAFEAFLGRS